MPSPLLYESHLHTPLCHHAIGLPGEYAAVAEKRGLRGIIVTCHAPMPDGYSSPYRMDIEDWATYLTMVEEAAEAWRGRVDIRLGLESEYVPGYLPWIESLHGRASFHHVLGSVHCQMHEYIETFFRDGSPDPWPEFQRTYFRHLAEAAETGLYDTLSHPDLVKNMQPGEWNVPRILDDIRRALDRIAAAGMAMELNTSGLNKTIPEMNPGPAILREMNARGIPVVLGADAHKPSRTGAEYPRALDLLRAAGYKEVSFFLNRQRQGVPIDEAAASLRDGNERAAVATASAPCKF